MREPGRGRGTALSTGTCSGFLFPHAPHSPPGPRGFPQSCDVPQPQGGVGTGFPELYHIFSLGFHCFSASPSDPACALPSYSDKNYGKNKLVSIECIRLSKSCELLPPGGVGIVVSIS